jgi:hypothetical protein
LGAAFHRGDEVAQTCGLVARVLRCRRRLGHVDGGGNPCGGGDVGTDGCEGAVVRKKARSLRLQVLAVG